ncbi:CCA tRNA nucleotidyltransferase, partial [Paenibacillus sepulcri]|nr:CCA tRNA nucleotidyltransferase [Paenibacillus sepulcri]
QRLRKPAGPWLGLLLNRLLQAAAFAEVANEKEQLLQYAELLYRSNSPEG